MQLLESPSNRAQSEDLIFVLAGCHILPPSFAGRGFDTDVLFHAAAHDTSVRADLSARDERSESRARSKGRKSV
jgi:hypothetical protein